MNILSLIMSLIIAITPSSTFICGDQPLEVKIINNENGDFKMINEPSKIDAGAFVVLDWKVNLMLPRTFINNEISFSDNKWKWMYQKDNNPVLIEKKRAGNLIKYECETLN